MDSTKVLDQLDSLIDVLLTESNLPACSLASMLIAARDSVRDGYDFALARRVWLASNADFRGWEINQPSVASNC
jgi:hypothetical protein